MANTVKLTDGREKAVEKLTTKDLDNIVLTKNTNGQDCLPMKAAIINEDDGNECKVERRVYKWGPMPKVVMYDLTIPKTVAKATELWGESLLTYAVGNYTVEQDKEHNGIVGTSKAETFRKEFLNTLKTIPADQLEGDAMKPLLEVIATKCKMSVAEIIEEVAKG